jgi:hypothetical protein
MQGPGPGPIRSPNVCDVSHIVRTRSIAEHCVAKVLLPRHKGREFAYFVIQRPPGASGASARQTIRQGAGDLSAEDRSHSEQLGHGDLLSSNSQVVTYAGVPVDKTP